MAVHKKVGENPLFEPAVAAEFSAYLQVPHDTLHCELLGISKVLAEHAAELMNERTRRLVQARVAVLAASKLCNVFNLDVVNRWNGRDIRQFIRVASLVLAGLPGIPADLLECCMLEAHVLWYLTNPEWSTKLETEFVQIFTKQRFALFQNLIPTS